MVEATQKTSVYIPSCIISKELIRQLGQLLESENLLKNRLIYSLDTNTKELTSKNANDFVQADWGSDLNKIKIDTIDNNFPQLTITMRLHENSKIYNKFSLSSKDATWVNGLSKRIDEIFRNHRTSYYLLENSLSLRVGLACAISLALFMYPLYLLQQHSILSSNSVLIISILTIAYGAMGFTILIRWLLPHLDYESLPQKRVRKWVSIILIGSGLIPAIILRLLGL